MCESMTDEIVKEEQPNICEIPGAIGMKHPTVPMGREAIKKARRVEQNANVRRIDRTGPHPTVRL